MNNIEILRIEELSNPIFIKPKRIFYKQNNVQKSWEIVESFDSVAILLYHKNKEAFVLVKQFRPAVYQSHKNGFTYELCAGLVDKDKSLKEIAKEEILEETGYDVKLENIEKITSFFTNVGFAGGKQQLYFACIEEKDKISNGGGIDVEDIEVIYLPINEAKEFMFDEETIKTPGLMFAFLWFLDKYK